MKRGTSIGVNYCAVCRTRSRAEFIAKLGVVIEETDKSVFWLEIIIENKLLKKEFIEPPLKETN